MAFLRPLLGTLKVKIRELRKVYMSFYTFSTAEARIIQIGPFWYKSAQWFGERRFEYSESFPWMVAADLENCIRMTLSDR
jgi:hypothetical protein